VGHNNRIKLQTENHKTRKKKMTSVKTIIKTSIGRRLLRSSFILIALALVCFWLLPVVEAVSPAPDGGYPGGNTAEGQAALFSLTSGTYNTAVGLFSLRSNTEGPFNTATGAGTLLVNTGDENTAAGAGALLSNATGTQNTANGAFAIFSNTTGSSNTATGAGALLNNTTGAQNTANGFEALIANTTGVNNTANGFQALIAKTTGDNNTADGYAALSSNTTGNVNTAAGESALESNTTGSGNTANGVITLTDNTTGSGNTAIGIGALSTNTTGSFNTALGDNAGSLVTTASSVICIGAPGANVDNSCFIGQIFGITATGGTAVFINSDGKLGTTTSSRRFKKEIQPTDGVSEAILSLKPVTFHYKNDNTKTPQFGLIAEEVAEVNPDLVVRDKKDEIYTVRYEAVNAMLLNEFLKEHKKVEAQQATITELKSTVAQQQKGMEVLAAQLKQQAAQIQNVNAKIEMGKAAPQIVTNP
jgi:uncharacterized coiled-coil protein SlyX